MAEQIELQPSTGATPQRPTVAEQICASASWSAASGSTVDEFQQAALGRSPTRQAVGWETRSAARKAAGAAARLGREASGRREAMAEQTGQFSARGSPVAKQAARRPSVCSPRS